MNWIVTESGQYYRVNEKMEITQSINNSFSGNWKLLGFRMIYPFARTGNLINPLEMLDQNMKFKNGKGRYVLVDLDHGTTRQWGDHICGFFHTNN